jgi:PhoH-like ATPase
MSEKQPGTKKKMYVLDTNILLHDPRALFNFKDGVVGIPIAVLEELEKFKKETSERGKSARDFIRYLDEKRKDGSLSEGVQLDNGGSVKVLFPPEEMPYFSSLNADLVDNEILLNAVAIQNTGQPVKFISKDLNARVKADVLGLESEDYLKGHIPREEFYKGWVRLMVPAVQLKQDIPEDLAALTKEYKFMPNEYVLVESQHNPHNCKVFRYIGGKKQFKPIVHPSLRWELGARNPQQLMALDALFDPSLELVTLLGPAGTGKTFLALLAGLHQVLVQDIYQKLMVSRPVVPLGPDIGYLPGDLQEKMHSWMQPVYDNVDVILHATSVGQSMQASKEEPVASEDQNEKGSKKKSKKKSYAKRARKDRYAIHSVDDLVSQGTLSLEAITYMRGRSIPYQFILIDEVQNLSPHETKTIISRVGQGSKIVLCGDPYQIDSPYLDFSSNGLVVSSDKFKEQKLFSTVFLESSERSELSQLAGELM